MSLTLGEKLRQAREERGITISEVAEQTRIAPLYIESIEENDYKPLPGGIFNKGFVKSYARYVGVDEQEALSDYARLIAEQEGPQTDEPKTYRPEVLTDERASGLRFSTIVFAVIILGLMTWGIYTLAKYFDGSQSTPVANNTNTAANANANATPANTANNANVSSGQTVSMNNLKVEFKAVGAPISVSTTVDGKRSSALVTPEKALTFEPKDNFKISYAKVLSQNAQLTINGKTITLPTAPGNPKRNVIEIEINKDNINQIWQSGQISPVV